MENLYTNIRNSAIALACAGGLVLGITGCYNNQTYNQPKNQNQTTGFPANQIGGVCETAGQIAKEATVGTLNDVLNKKTEDSKIKPNLGTDLSDKK